GPKGFLGLRPVFDARLETDRRRDAPEIGEDTEGDRPVKVVRTHVSERASDGTKPDARFRRGSLRGQHARRKAKQQYALMTSPLGSPLRPRVSGPGVTALVIGGPGAGLQSRLDRGRERS